MQKEEEINKSITGEHRISSRHENRASKLCFGELGISHEHMGLYRRGLLCITLLLGTSYDCLFLMLLQILNLKMTKRLSKINTQYQEKLVTVRAQQASLPNEFLRKESQVLHK
ncbi:hypothetical protein IEQ34_015252 [Dendrobium chrysotoxum]|uniref:Transmembrane protein n=1 Tax=Dendrobium chrysotoxum TaxID=161865 RepID=A0AAV7FZL5_DENCH|nr:hypothetical protein IEQ34_015252 [Dendrobium chrysotoxum]